MASPTDSPTWRSLRQCADRFQQPDFRLDSLFSATSDRFTRYSGELDGLLVDYSKNYLDEETFDLLIRLAKDRGVPKAIAAMFAGEDINNTEHRPALHIALREPVAQCRFPEVAQTLARMEEFTAAVHEGRWLGYSGKRITDVVNIGIGGSDLGPAMVCDALADMSRPEPRVRFVSNVDPSHLRDTLQSLSPESTLFIVASKSFTTLETRQNADSARRWLLAAGGEPAVARHFVANTSNKDAAVQFGIDADNLFPLWDWVGGRYSVWSAIGLPIALALGMDRFYQLLRGAHHMDRHFQNAPLAENLPVILGLLGIWYRGFFQAASTAVVPYNQRLAQLPAFLQQLCMESLGKRVRKDGTPVKTPTGEVLWGSAGTNGQHSYFQLLHQGTAFVPVDFIASATPGPGDGHEAHRYLLANCLSQSLALMRGTPGEHNPHKQVPGNKPSNTLLLSRLDPVGLGALIALYEHKVYVQSVIWDINAFDQWGVELGKALSHTLYAGLADSGAAAGLDASSVGLIDRINHWNKA